MKHIAILAAMMLVHAAAAQEAAPSNGPNEAEARTRFTQGIALARAGNCKGAISEFEESLRLMERPNTMFNIAKCQEELGRYDLAVKAYERYLSVAPADAEDRGTVEVTLRTLRQLLGTIEVTTNVPAEVWMDDRIVGQTPGGQIPGNVLVPGGTHTIELRAEGRLAERRQVQVTSRQTLSVSVELKEAVQHVTEQHITEQHVTQQNTTVRVERPPVAQEVFWTGVGLTTVTLGVGFGIGGYALTLADKEKQMHILLRNPNEVKDMALISDVFLASGTLLGITTLVMAFMTDFGGQEETKPDANRATAMRFMPGLSMGEDHFVLKMEGVF